MSCYFTYYCNVCKLINVLVVRVHHVVLTPSFKLLKFFTFISFNVAYCTIMGCLYGRTTGYIIRNRTIFLCTACPADFTYIPSVKGCYKLVNRSLIWTAAGQECRSLHRDAHLLVISDALEQLAIAGMLASNRQFLSFYSFYTSLPYNIHSTVAVKQHPFHNSLKLKH